MNMKYSLLPWDGDPLSDVRGRIERKLKKKAQNSGMEIVLARLSKEFDYDAVCHIHCANKFLFARKKTPKKLFMVHRLSTLRRNVANAKSIVCRVYVICCLCLGIHLNMSLKT